MIPNVSPLSVEEKAFTYLLVDQLALPERGVQLDRRIRPEETCLEAFVNVVSDPFVFYRDEARDVVGVVRYQPVTK